MTEQEREDTLKELEAVNPFFSRRVGYWTWTAAAWQCDDATIDAGVQYTHIESLAESCED